MKFGSGLNLRNKGLILVSVPLLFQLLFFIAFAKLISIADDEFDKQLLSQTILLRMQKLENVILESVSAFGAATIAMQDVPSETLDRLAKNINECRPYFDWLLTVRPERAGTIERSREIVDKASKLVPELKKYFGEGSKTPFDDRFKYLRGDLSGLMLSVMASVSTQLEDEEKVQVTFPEQGRKLESYVAIACGIAIIVNLALAIFLAEAIGNDLIVRLSKAAGSARMLAIDKPLAPPVGGNDEIAELDAALRSTAIFMQESRLRERAILEHASQGLFSIDCNLKIITVSSPLARLIRYGEDDLLGLSLLEIIQEAERENVLQRITVLLGAGGDESIEVTFIRRDKSVMPALLSLSCSQDGQSVICVAHDITERKALERLRQQFVSMISHDIRTPLASTGGALQLIIVGAKGNVGEEVRSKLVEAERTVLRLSTLVQSILDLERLESGKVKLQSACLSLIDVMEESIERIAEKAGERGITIEKRLKDAPIVADERWTVDAIARILQHELGTESDALLITSAENGGMVEIIMQSNSTAPLPYSDWSNETESRLSIRLADVVIVQLGGMLRVLQAEKTRRVSITLPRFHEQETDHEVS